jgi:tryptophanyl-tRNA synthetase
MTRINLTDDADTIAAKIRKARTDAEPLPATATDLEGRPEAQNLVAILALLTGTTPDAICTTHAGQGFATVKPLLADALVATLAPINARFRDLLANPHAIDAALARGAERARNAAAQTLADVHDAVGFLKA